MTRRHAALAVRRRRAVPLLLAGLALAAAGCLAPRMHSVAAGRDLVRGEDEYATAGAAVLLEYGRGLVSQRIPGLRDTSVEVLVQRELHVDGLELPAITRGFTLTAEGQRPRIHVTTHGYPDALVHELTHALLGPDWSTLPIAVEEGLCELVAHGDEPTEMLLTELRLAARADTSSPLNLSVEVPGRDGEARMHGLLWGRAGGSDATASALTMDAILALPDTDALYALDPAEIVHAYGVGTLVVRRIATTVGVDGLHSLCLRAAREGHERVPAAWLREAAGIEDQQHFEALAAQALREASFDAALRAEPFARVLRAVLHDDEAVSLDSPEEMLSRCTFRLRLDGEPVELGGEPRFRAWLAENWDALVAPAAD